MSWIAIAKWTLVIAGVFLVWPIRAVALVCVVVPVHVVVLRASIAGDDVSLTHRRLAVVASHLLSTIGLVILGLVALVVYVLYAFLTWIHSH